MSGRVRRTQAERSAFTQAAIVEAAIESLYTNGYAATTTTVVAEAAHITRGAMLHHFGSKVDLMAHVVETVYLRELEAYGEAMGGLKGGADILLAMCEVVWEVLSRPSGVAVLEILQGSRSDPVLAERLKPVQAKIEANARRIVERNTGLRGDRALALMRLIVWSARGLSIAKVLAPDGEKVGDAVAMLRDMLENSIRTGHIKLDPYSEELPSARHG